MRKPKLLKYLPVMAASFLLLTPLKADAAKWQWVQTGTNLQYMDLDSTASDKNMLKSTFKTIKGFTYYFDADGYVLTGWLFLGRDSYFFRANGAMVKNAWIGDCYFGKNGKMARNTWIGGKKNGKYVGSDGHLVPNYSKKNRARFVKDKKGIRYRNSGGTFTKKDWECVKGHWYYFYSTGYMATDRKIGKYYVNKKGQMAVNKWVKIGKHKIYYGIDGRQNQKIRIRK